MYALPAVDLLDVVDTMWQDEVAEMRLLTTLAASAGAKMVMPGTREFVEKLRAEERLRDAESAHDPIAVQAAQQAESMFGGPA